MRRTIPMLAGACLVAAVAVCARIRITADDAEPATVKVETVAGPAAAMPAPTIPETTVTPAQQATHPTPLAATTATDDTDRLIHDLAGPNADNAQQALLDRGTAVLDRLKRAADKDRNPQVRVRATAIAAAILDQDATGATLINCHLDQAAPADLWAAIGRQGRCQIAGLPTAFPDRKVNLDANGESFWSAVTDGCAQTGVAPEVDAPPDHTLTLFPSAHNWLAETPHQIVGPYWVGVVGIDHRHTIPLVPGDPGENTFNVRLVLYAEPKLSLFAVSDFLVESATDDAGNALQPDPPLPAVLDKPTGHTITGRLRYPANPGKIIREIRGKTVVMLAEGNQWFRVDDVLGKPMTSNPVNGCDITATVAVISPGFYEVKVACDRTALDDQRWRAMLNGIDGLVVADAAGKPLRSMPWEPAKENMAVHFEATARFAKVRCGEPKSIRWEIASRFVPVDVPVAFHNLPMP